MKRYVFVVSSEYFTLNELLTFAVCSKGCLTIARDEFRLHRLKEFGSVIPRVPHDASPIEWDRTTEWLWKALELHQRELIPRHSRSAAPVEIPGMSSAEALEFGEVRFEWPAVHTTCRLTPSVAARSAWQCRSTNASADRTWGSAVGVGCVWSTASGSTAPSEALDFVVTFAVHRQLHTGVFAVVAVVAIDSLTSRVKDFYWSFRSNVDRVVMGCVGDDPIASHASIFPQLATIRVAPDEAAAPVSNTAADVVRDALASKSIESKHLAPFIARVDLEGDAPTPRVALETCRAVFASGLRRFEDVDAILHADHIAPLHERLVAFPQELYSHSKRFQNLQTPKGTYYCDTGISDITAVDVGDALVHTEARIRRYLTRTWDRGLCDMWTMGAVPVAILEAVVASTS